MGVCVNQARQQSTAGSIDDDCTCRSAGLLRIEWADRLNLATIYVNVARLWKDVHSIEDADVGNEERSHICKLGGKQSDLQEPIPSERSIASLCEGPLSTAVIKTGGTSSDRPCCVRSSYALPDPYCSASSRSRQHSSAAQSRTVDNWYTRSYCLAGRRLGGPSANNAGRELRSIGPTASVEPEQPFNVIRIQLMSSSVRKTFRAPQTSSLREWFRGVRKRLPAASATLCHQ